VNLHCLGPFRRRDRPVLGSYYQDWGGARASLEIRPDRVETEKRLGAPRGFGSTQVGKAGWAGWQLGKAHLFRTVYRCTKTKGR